ncbi:MAG TPA: immunoglobulin domain-containing protein [Verrucomicrobiae bacterium]|nr:immunoglobulin domain-containing protein [Verrucomicrobiae bacterium]
MKVRKRPWDARYLSTLSGMGPGSPIQFELVDGEMARGIVGAVRRSGSEVVRISGEISEPAKGNFFFQKQTMPGVAGEFVGLVTMPEKPMAYRIEPTGQRAAPELIERPIDDVVCRGFPAPRSFPSRAQPDIPPLDPAQYPDVPIPGYQNGIVSLESLHGATAVVYLDFQGGYTPSWGGVSYDRPAVSNAQIRDVWKRVAEDFMPFKINVTTDLGVFQSAPDNGRQHVIITPTTTVAAEAGGVAMIGSFNWTGDTPCWVFTISGKQCAEACSHEVGHTLGLTHDGQEYGGQLFEYYDGHGIGDTSWAPIMGVPYFANVTQWSKGEYTNADNPEDQLAMITSQNNYVSYRPDDTGDTLATSRYLELFSDYRAFAEGVIERTGDTDAFQFTTSGGTVLLRADPVNTGPDLAIQVSLCDQNDVPLLVSNPQNTLWSGFGTNLPAGTYTFRVTGAGRNNPLTNGFTAYASLGYYAVTGLVVNARLPDRFAVPEHATNGTVVGTIRPLTTNDSFSFSIASGNIGNTFALQDNGVLSVADNTLLDYAQLAAHTQLAVQFELFIDIIDNLNPNLNETNRRVVVAVFHVPTPPQILSASQDIVLPAGSSLLLDPQLIGDAPLSYQWYFDQSPIIGAQGPVLALTNVQSRDSGTYALTVTNLLGAVTQTIDRLSVTSSLPVIVVQPQPQGTAAGFPASFSVEAVGTQPLAYQWLLNGTNIAFATLPTLSVPSATPDLAGAYQVMVSNPLGVVTSSVAGLYLEPVAAWGWNGDGQTNLYLALTNAVQIAAGPSYNLALKRDGTVFGWGNTNQAPIPANLTNAVAVAAGGDHSVALLANGTVRSCGGASGPGITGPPPGLAQIVAVAAGGSHSLALRSDGKVFGWGLNATGQITIPVLLTNVITIAAGSNHSLAISGDGKVWAWGDNSSGQCQVPTNLQSAVAIAAGAGHSLALQMDGTVAAWGDNRYGQSSVPAGLSGIIAVAAGADHSLALSQVGTLYAWGAGATNAQLFPNFGQCLVPQPVRNGNNTSVAAGAAHTVVFNGSTAPFISQAPVGCAAFSGRPIMLRVAATGARPLTYQWTRNGTNLSASAGPLLVVSPTTSADAGDYQVIVANTLGAVTSAVARVVIKQAPPVIVVQPASQQPLVGGQLQLSVTAYGTEPLFYQWRLNGLDLDGATDRTLSLSRLSPNQSGYYSVIVSNALGSISSAKAKISVLQVVAWGAGTNNSGSLSYGQSIVPLGLSQVSRVAGGGYHSLALESAGRVIAWGAGTNNNGAYAYGQSLVPGSVSGITAIAAGMFHSLALRADGYVFGWGFVPEQIPGPATIPSTLSDVIAIAAGRSHSVALRRDGRPVVWAPSSSSSLTNIPAVAVNLVAIASRNNQIVGVRGDGTVVRWGSPSPVPANLNGVIDVAAGSFQAFALKGNGTVASLDNTVLPAGLSNVVQIAAGYEFGLALRSDGTVATWGSLPGPYSINPPPGMSNVTSVACGDYNFLATLGDGSASICAQPLSRAAAVGDSLFLRVGATGHPPLTYQWYFNNAAVLGATGAVLQLGSFQTSKAGDYFAVVANGFGAITSSVASLSLAAAPPPTQVSLSGALGSPGLVWTTGPGAGWFGQTNVTLAGSPTAQSGRISDSQQTWVQTSVVGPGRLSFWWKVSSEQYFDFLNCYMDGSLLGGISGEVDWQSTNFFIAAGSHSVQWNYQKDPSTSTGLDAGWLANVSFVPDLPVILYQPLGQTSWMGSNIVLSASVLGAAPLSLQWLKDGFGVPGATDTTFVIRNATRHNSGAYQFAATNLNGAALSILAPVLVRVPQKLIPLPAQVDGTFRLLSADADGAPLMPADITGFRSQSTTNLQDWRYLSNVLQLTNGALLLSVPIDPSNAPAFYRVIERGQ